MCQPTADDAFPTYKSDHRALARLQARWQMIIGPVAEEIVGATVLDIGAYDGRWSYAFAAAGASEVTAVEPRCAALSKLSDLPAGASSAKIKAENARALDYLETACAEGTRYDVVALLGFFYHTLEHLRLISLISKLQPKLIIIDSEFVITDNPIIQIAGERTDNPMNAVGAKAKTLVGIPSLGAIKRLSEDIGYDLSWVDIAMVPPSVRSAIPDYARTGRK